MTTGQSLDNDIATLKSGIEKNAEDNETNNKDLAQALVEIVKVDSKVDGLKSALTDLSEQVSTLIITVADNHKSVNNVLENFNERLNTLEGYHDGEPTPDPEPDPDLLPWPAFFIDFDTGIKTELLYDNEEITAYEGNYTVEIGEGEAPDIPRPVKFFLDGVQIGNENNVPIQAAGDNNPIPFKEGGNELSIQVGEESYQFTFIIEKDDEPAPDPDPEPDPTPDPDPEPEPDPQSYKIQVGPWFPAPFNLEDPYINFLLPSTMYWDSSGDQRIKDLVDKGWIDPKNGMPTTAIGTNSVQTGIYFSVGSQTGKMPLRDGDWVLEGDGAAKLKARNLRTDEQTQIGDARLEFSRNAAEGKTPWDERFYVSNVTKPFTKLALYRKEHEQLYKEGKIYNPEFLKKIEGYDVVRMMDLQSANGAVITSIDDVATMDSIFWGSSDYGNATGEAWSKYPAYYQSMPIESALKLGVEGDKEIWFQAPMTLGAPDVFWDVRPEAPNENRQDIWSHNFGVAAGSQAKEVIESPEWDRYADAFVAALISSGYPADRPLYVSLANEVWNWTGHYFFTTKYAEQLGKGLRDIGYLGIDGVWIRECYGALVARFKVAMDGAFARADRSQNITYVLEGQAVWADLTSAACRGAKAYIEKIGENWDDHKGDFGASVASYFGWDDPTSKGVDVNNLEELADYFLNGPETDSGTKANVIKHVRDNINRAALYGVKFIGFYEGSWHFGKPASMSRELYTEFLWGPLGANVNYEINKALTKEFPGVILSNYVLGGAKGGQPWFEDITDPDAPYNQSWQRLIAEKNVVDN